MHKNALMVQRPSPKQIKQPPKENNFAQYRDSLLLKDSTQIVHFNHYPQSLVHGHIVVQKSIDPFVVKSHSEDYFSSGDDDESVEQHQSWKVP